MSILKNAAQVLLGPLGNIWRIADAIKDSKTNTPTDEASEGFNKLGDALGSELGMNVSPAEKERYGMNLDYLRDSPSAQVEGMEKAGLNPALMYGSASTPSSANVQPSAGGLANLLSLAMMPAQVELMKAQADATRANAGYTRQRTLTEEQITKIQSVLSEFQYDVSSATLNSLIADVDNLYSQINLRSSQENLVHNQADAQAITNKYLDSRLSAEIDNLLKEGKKLDSDTALNKSREAYQDWFNNFVRKNDFLPSSNDALLIGTYLGSVFGAEKSDLTKILDPDKIPVVRGINVFRDLINKYKNSKKVGSR